MSLQNQYTNFDYFSVAFKCSEWCLSCRKYRQTDILVFCFTYTYFYASVVVFMYAYEVYFHVDVWKYEGCLKSVACKEVRWIKSCNRK